MPSEIFLRNLTNRVDATFPVWHTVVMTTTTTFPTVTVPVTLDGRTEIVTFMNFGGKAYDSKMVFAGRIARGGKMHKASIHGYLRSSRDEVSANTPLEQTHEFEDGTVFEYRLTTTALNRACFVSAWADDYEGSRNGAKGNGYNSLHRA
jgi:hypothetical protein